VKNAANQASIHKPVITLLVMNVETPEYPSSRPAKAVMVVSRQALMMKGGHSAR
jgi:hypothetical protein